jgi:hypothetical protein
MTDCSAKRGHRFSGDSHSPVPPLLRVLNVTGKRFPKSAGSCVAVDYDLAFLNINKECVFQALFLNLKFCKSSAIQHFRKCYCFCACVVDQGNKYVSEEASS